MSVLKRVKNKLITTKKNGKGIGKGLKDVKNSAVAKQNVHKTAGNIAYSAQRKVYKKLTPGEQPDAESSARAQRRDKKIILKDPVRGPKKVMDAGKKYGAQNISTKKRE